ncbi:MAG: DUF1828 domain-containing protein [Miltoncostaeaceae bacterium]
MSTLESIRDRFWSHLRDEVALTDAPEGLVECATLFTYDDGDAVVVWVQADPSGQVMVSDYAEAWMRLIGRGHETQDRQRADAVCTRYGVRFTQGAITASGRMWSVGGLILRVAEASARVAGASAERDVAGGGEGPRSGATREFRRLVTDTFRQRDITVENDLPVTGASGKTHKIPLFLPQTEHLVAPMPSSAPGSLLSSVFMRFADVGSVNGYTALTIIDDRGGAPQDETINLLGQVGGTALWSERVEWIDAVTPHGA